jgi:hypothetical protein
MLKKFKRAPVITGTGPWELTTHCCQICLGRVLRSTDSAVYRCAECGATAAELNTVCCCGAKFPTSRADKAGRSARLQCIPNPSVSPTCPIEIIVMEATQ